MAKADILTELPFLIIVIIVALVAVISLAINRQTGLQGAAVMTPEIKTVFGCVDDDVENNPAVAGFVQVKKMAYPDFCFQNTLKQYQCGKNGQALLARDFRCAYGCADGACKKQQDQ